MILTTEIAAHPLLRKFVRFYTYRQFNTNGKALIRPWHAIQQISIPFFFKSLPVKLTDPDTGQILKTGKPTGVVGVGGRFNGNMEFNGDYSFFEIQVLPTGFSQLFQIPGKEIVDHIFWGEEVFARDHAILHEKLFHSKTVEEMKEHMDEWLLAKFSRTPKKQVYDRVTFAANKILRHHGMVNLSQLIQDVNMSRRSFERNFINEVGISPKHLCCIARFNNAFETKLNQPELDWTAIAQDTGYYDQMHLIKEFKRFAGDAPRDFLNVSPMMQVAYSERVEE